jgi:uncharacterized membrane protein YphA (DoxX/SURF4 family)
VNVLAWVLQIVLALIFLFHGIVYSLAPEPLIRSMRDQGAWPPSIPNGFRVFIGIAEILAAIGLILPALTHVAPVLTPLAAVGLVIVMAGAIVYHARRGEIPMVAVTAVLLVLAAVTAYLRFVTVPIT